MKVRDAENAVVDLAKLQLYCLDKQHACGRNKARQFESKLGLVAHDADELRARILEVVVESDDAELGERDEFGQRYRLDVEVTGPAGTARVRTSWITRTRDRAPHLATCYVL